MCTSRDEILTQELNQKRYELNRKLSREWIMNGGVSWIPNLIEVLEDTDRMYALSKNNPDYMLYPYSIPQVRNYLKEVFRLYDKEDLCFLFERMMMITWEDKKSFNPNDIWDIYRMLYHPVLGIRGFDLAAIINKDAKAVDHTIEQMGHFRHLFFKRLISIAKDAAKATKLTNKKEEKKMARKSTTNTKSNKNRDTKFASLLHEDVFDKLRLFIQDNLDQDPEFNTMSDDQKQIILKNIPDKLIPRLNLFNEDELRGMAFDLFSVFGEGTKKFSPVTFNFNNSFNTLIKFFHIRDIEEINRLKNKYNESYLKGLSKYSIKRLLTDDIPTNDVDDQIPFYEPDLALVPICLDVKCDDTGSANQEMVKSEMDTVKAIFNYPPSLRLNQNHRTIFPFYIPQLGEMKYSLQYQGMHILTIKSWMDYRIYPFERVDGYKVDVDPNKIKHPERSICLSFQFQHNSFFACENLLDKLWNSIKNRNYHITAYAMEKVGTQVRIVESSRWFCTNLDVFNEYAPLHPGLNNLNHRLLMFSTQDLQKHFDVEQYNAGWVGPFIEFDEKIFPD